MLSYPGGEGGGSGRCRGLKGSRGGDRKSLDGRKKFRMSREALEWGGAGADGPASKPCTAHSPFLSGNIHLFFVSVGAYYCCGF